MLPNIGVRITCATRRSYAVELENGAGFTWRNVLDECQAIILASARMGFYDSQPARMTSGHLGSQSPGSYLAKLTTYQTDATVLCVEFSGRPTTSLSGSLRWVARVRSSGRLRH